MILKKLLPTFFILLSLTVAAQKKTFAFSEIQSRNDRQEWNSRQSVGARFASFSPTEINLNIDRDYRLQILSKTDLPNKGVIYLCKDDKANSVTVMLIDNIKMYVYSKTSRFLINFDRFKSEHYMADAD